MMSAAANVVGDHLIVLVINDLENQGEVWFDDWSDCRPRRVYCLIWLGI